jgi:hypothetical protein
MMELLVEATVARRVPKRHRYAPQPAATFENSRRRVGKRVDKLNGCTCGGQISKCVVSDKTPPPQKINKYKPQYITKQCWLF